jgi:hypothetical protein
MPSLLIQTLLETKIFRSVCDRSIKNGSFPVGYQETHREIYKPTEKVQLFCGLLYNRHGNYNCFVDLTSTDSKILFDARLETKPVANLGLGCGGLSANLERKRA